MSTTKALHGAVAAQLRTWLEEDLECGVAVGDYQRRLADKRARAILALPEMRADRTEAKPTPRLTRAQSAEVRSLVEDSGYSLADARAIVRGGGL